MIYSQNNVMSGASVFDVASKQKIPMVMEINQSAGWLKVCEQPLKVTSHGRVATRRVRFQAIHAINGAEPMPCLFLCYGPRG